MLKVTRALRHRSMLLPLGAAVVVLLSYALLAVGGANGRPNRPTSAAVQDPVTQAEPPGRRDGDRGGGPGRHGSSHRLLAAADFDQSEQRPAIRLSRRAVRAKGP